MSYDDEITEETGLLARMENIPTTIVVENRTSEPRDALLSERTTLSWIRFAATLMLSSVAIVLDYRLETNDDNNNDNNGGGDDDSGDHFTKSRAYILSVGLVFTFAGLGAIVLSGYNYFQTLDHCISQKIHIFNPRPTLYLLTVIVLLLLAVSITLIADEM